MDHGKQLDRDGFSSPWWAFPPLRNALLAGGVAGAAIILQRFGPLGAAVASGTYVAAILLGGWHWMREGVDTLLEEHAVGIEALMGAATAGSAILGMWEEAAALVVLYGAAEGLEEYTYARTRAAIRALLDLVPKKARVLHGGCEVMVPVESLRPGDRFVVRPGESIPTDGTVIEGRSGVNEAPVTGESIPVDKEPGLAVFAASLNGEGALLIEATRSHADNTLARIIHLVETAQTQKGRAQQWIEHFGRRYSPAVLAVGAAMVVLPLIFGWPLAEWSRRAVVLLVASAPCALIMSTPMAAAAGIGGAGRRGILIKGGVHLEHLGKARVVAFDKTGTLTRGKPAMTDVRTFGVEEAELLAGVAGVEHYSQHPLARTIVEDTAARGIERRVARDFVSLTGAGARATIDGAGWIVASPAWFAASGVALAGVEADVAELQGAGKTVVLAARNGEMCGWIALQDQLRPEAAECIETLRRMGVRTVMLTGDNAGTAAAVASQLGIDDVRAELLPEGKLAAVKALEQEYGPVLMVGDGVNDAPALAAATCGIAMGAAGTDAALEAADVALMKDDLRKVAEALVRGRRTRRISLQNIVFSIALLMLLIPLAVGGLIGVASAVLVHEAAELLAVANGLRAGTAGPSHDRHRAEVNGKRAA
ncbi:MAG: heavy metal translocating P-type ATPase [Nevskia sp.]|nr:heavy metal translocating P-type ATPase [Nevskia sp.]